MHRVLVAIFACALVAGVIGIFIIPTAFAIPDRYRGTPHVIVAAYGTHTYLGTIVATTTKNNHDTATPFNNTGDALKGMTLLVQPDVACYILAGTANTATVTTSNGLLLQANEKYVTSMLESHGWLAALPVTGTCTMKVWRIQ